MTKIVQVLGPARSGTTITHLMIGNAPDAFACGEVYAFFRPWRTYHFKPICSCGLDYDKCIWRKFEGINERYFYRYLSEHLGIEWIVDESKRLDWVLDSQQWAKENDMGIYNILMFKEPIDLMYSYWKRGVSMNSVKRAFLGYYGKFVKLNIPFVSVSLNELVNVPSEKLKSICNVIGMPYFPGKERFWEGRHCHLFGSLGVKRQLKEGNVQISSSQDYPPDFLSLAQPLLKHFKKNERVRRIYNLLKKNEVDNINIESYIGKPKPLVKKIHPAWYYRLAIKSKWRKHHPQKWRYEF